MLQEKERKKQTYNGKINNSNFQSKWFFNPPTKLNQHNFGSKLSKLPPIDTV